MFGMSNRSGAARAKWTQLVEEQKNSGLSVTAFCAGRSIPATSLFAWRRKLAREGAAGSEPPPVAEFIEAHVRDADEQSGNGVGGGDGGVTIELCRGRRVKVARG